MYLREVFCVRMPENGIETLMFAPCGMNCKVCYRHCSHKKPCGGCLISDLSKPEHCRKCKIKDCIREKGLSYCHECSEFPCKRIKSLEKSYRSRYSASLLQNSRFVCENGLEAFMRQQKEMYTCPKCGGIVSIHGFCCSECGQAVKS